MHIPRPQQAQVQTQLCPSFSSSPTTTSCRSWFIVRTASIRLRILCSATSPVFSSPVAGLSRNRKAIIRNVALFSELPEHLQLIATFAVHTGLRDEELRALRWNWIRETGNVTFFSLPETLTKNGQARPVVLNRSALQVIKRAHGRHPEFVFVHKPRAARRGSRTRNVS